MYPKLDQASLTKPGQETVGLPVGLPDGLPVGLPVDLPVGQPVGLPVDLPVGLSGVQCTVYILPVCPCFSACTVESLLYSLLQYVCSTPAVCITTYMFNIKWDYSMVRKNVSCRSVEKMKFILFPMKVS